jgi:hypothetical protein
LQNGYFDAPGPITLGREDTVAFPVSQIFCFVAAVVLTMSLAFMSIKTVGRGIDARPHPIEDLVSRARSLDLA